MNVVRIPAGLPVGLVAIAKMNTKRRFFLASKENYFAGHKVENVMMDSGCNTLLLPIRDGELTSFLTKFPKDTYCWEISGSKGVSHNSLVLNISLNTAGPMNLELCKDLLSVGSITSLASSDFLRFHLCSSDMQQLGKEKELSTRLSAACLERIKDYRKSHPTTVNRRLHGLLGQALLSDFACTQLRGIMAIFQPEQYKPMCGWEDMARLRVYVNARSDLLPERFNDLEDEDHVLDAIDTDHEDYHPFINCEFIDECE